MDNMRLWSAELREEDCRWRVEPGDTKGVERARRLLAEYVEAEPGAGWRLETRGASAAWHPWAE